MKYVLISGVLILGLICSKAQYVAEVLRYTPAPGQFINTIAWGIPSAAGSIVGGVQGSLSLGAFGGEVVFRFDNAVENHPDNPFGVDFTIFGNSLSHWSEPGVVWVMEDRNNNGLSDDTWFEIAGSDYYFSGTRQNYRVTYSNPGGTVAEDVPWKGPEGESGVVRANAAHQQPYYPLTDSFPHIPPDLYILTGTLIEGAVEVDHPPMMLSVKRKFGYADNQVRGSPPYTIPDNPYTDEVEHSGGDAFDLDWAVDSSGSYVELERIHFVRVQTGILHEGGGWLGEISTEITGIVDVPPEPGLSGSRDMVVVRDLPFIMDTTTRKLEVFCFEGGRKSEEHQVVWSSSAAWATVNEEHVLTMNGTGALTLSASLASNPQVSATVSTTVVEEITTSHSRIRTGNDILVYPNPARDRIYISGSGGRSVTLYNLAGDVVHCPVDAEREEIGISHLPAGLYLIQVGKGTGADWLKLVKM